MRIVKSPLLVLLVASLFSSLSFAVTADRIAGAVDATNLVQLNGHVAPMAQPQFDQGPASPLRKLQVSMLFLPTVQQDQALKRLLDDLQDSKSPHFHKWLTAPQYADQFGLNERDLAKVSAWLTSQGFKVTYAAHGRDYIAFEGSVAQVESTFKTEIHNYSVDGKMHFGNATAPMIPAALSGIVGGFRGLHNFFPKPMLRKHPDYSVSVTGGFFTTLAPGDIATIYDINPLYQLATPIDGTGQKVVIAGQSDVFLADLNNFRTDFGLPTISGCTTDSTGLITSAHACNTTYFQMVVPTGSADPGAVSGDLGESDLDIEWVGSVARKAQIIFVTSGSQGGVDDSASFAIDNQLAPVMSYSYGLCEAWVTAPGITSAEVEFKKAAALGISFFASSGDNGAATCDQPIGDFPVTLGPSVSYPASSAYVTGVGGTEFNEAGSTAYWSSTNGPNGVSAQSYIPELAWNDTVLVGAPDGTGGGPSNCVAGTGTTTVQGFLFEVCNAPPNGGFPKPSWQVGVTPTDGVRDVPDISFSASNANDPYIVCTPEEEVSTTTTSTTSTCHTSINDALLTWNSAFGGTSASTPVAAGMIVLLNQYLGTNGLGNMNPQLYKFHGTTPSAFNDTPTSGSTSTTTTDDNIVACTVGAPGNLPGFSGWPAALNCPNTGLIGFSAGAGYDLVTGLGSINFNTLFTNWKASRVASSTAIVPSSTNVNIGTSVTFTATVTPSATSSGTVSFSTLNGGVTTALGTALINLANPSAMTGTATLATTALPGGTNNVTATFLGDAAHNASTSTAATVMVIAPDFNLGLSKASDTVVAGHALTNPVTVTVTPVNGYNQPTTFSCATPPAGVTCAFSPNPVTPNGTNPITSVLTISTSAGMATGAQPAFNVSATNGGSISHTSGFTLTVNATDQSFTIADTTTHTVTRPASVSATLTLTPTNGFNSPVTYTCVDTVAETTCTGPTGATTTTSPQFTITTTAPTRAMALPANRNPRLFYAMLLPGLLGVVFAFGSRQRSLRGMRVLGLIMVLGVSTMWMGACGGGGGGGGTHDPGTPTGPQTVTINATTGGANALTATTTINFTVN